MTSSAPQFWDPKFSIDHREDGTILMYQDGQPKRLCETMPERLVHWATVAPDRIYLAQRNKGGEWQEMTYGEVYRAVRSLGTRLLNLGLTPERPVVILSENSIEHALLALGAQYVGIPSASISTAFSLVAETHDKLRSVVEQLDPGLIFAAGGATYGRALDAVRAKGVHILVSRNPDASSDLIFGDLLATQPSAAADDAYEALTPDTVAKYLFTSGSTGAPKAVINTQRMLVGNQAMVRDCFRFLEDHPPVVLDWAPWSHTASGNKVSGLVLYNGGSFYIDEGKPTKAGMVETMRNLQDVSPTWYFNVPVGYDMLLDAFKTDPELREKFFSRLDMMMYAGAGMAQHTWDGLRKAAKEATGRDILLTTGLGATETGPFALQCATQFDQPGNVGVPALGVVLKLVPNGGKLEARVKSPSITPGYLGDADKTAEVFDDEGFYCLGDALRPADPDDLTKGFFFDGRIAENFKLATGTWVAVGALRAKMVDHFDGLIRDAVIVGENMNELGALVFPNEGVLERLGDDAEEVFGKALTTFAEAATGSSNRVARLVVLRVPPSLDRGEVTDKGSINQRAVREGRPDAVAAVFDGPKGVRFV